MRMSKVRILSIALFGLIVINLILLAFYFYNKPPNPSNEKPPVSKRGPQDLIIKQLHFDKDQVFQYEKLIDDHRKIIKVLEDSISITKNELYLTLESGNTSEKDSLISRLANLQKEIEFVHYDHFTDIKKICKPDQLVYYNELISNLADFFNPLKKLPPPPKDN